MGGILKKNWFEFLEQVLNKKQKVQLQFIDFLNYNDDKYF